MRRQRGFTLILGMLLVLVLATSVFLGSRQGAALQQAERGVEQQRALATARDVLVAYALALGTNSHPGALPCPDMDGNGTSNNTDCQGDDVYLGRVPFATLDVDVGSLHGVDEIWFALDDAFVDFNPPGGSVNTGTEPSLQIGTGSARYPAVLILAGDPLAHQGSARPGSDDAVDYLEGDNVEGDPLQFAGCDSDACNDRVVGITKSQLLDPVRELLLAEVRDALASYFDDHGELPQPAPLGAADGACDDSVSPPRGTLPVASDGSCTDYLDDDDFSTEGEWVTDNDWHRWVYYAVAGPCAPGSVQPCDATAPDLLTLGDDGGRAVIFATVGEPVVTPGKGALQDRGAMPPHAVKDYLDSPENVNGNDVFDDPDNDDAGENDRLRAIAAPSP